MVPVLAAEAISCCQRFGSLQRGASSLETIMGAKNDSVKGARKQCFLILPWVSARNLPSSLLTTVARQFPNDWGKRYRYRSVLLKTFVDERFCGCCYRAAS